MKYFIIVFFLFTVHVLSAQKTLTKQQAEADIDSFFQIIEVAHPCLHCWTPKTIIDSFIIVSKEKCYDGMRKEELAAHLNQAQHYFDYHTGLYFRDLSFYFKKSNSLFPYVTIVKDGIYMKENGYAITQVNGVSMYEIAEIINNMYAKDYHQNFLIENMNRRGVFQYALSYMGINAPFEINVTISNNQDSIIYINEGISYNEFSKKLLQNNNLLHSFKDYSFKISKEQSVAIIYYDKCLDVNKQEQFDKFLQNCFAQIKKQKIKNLFIDVSLNPGGTTDCNDLILRYIKLNKKHPEYISLEKHPSYRKECDSELKDKFKGNIYIYQSYYTRSAAPNLVKRLKGLYEKTTIAGTDTETLHTYRNSKIFTLKNSGLTCKVALRYENEEEIYSFLTDENLTRNLGIKPDIEFPLMQLNRLNFDHCKQIMELKKKS